MLTSSWSVAAEAPVRLRWGALGPGACPRWRGHWRAFQCAVPTREKRLCPRCTDVPVPGREWIPDLSLWVHFPHGLYLICWAIWVNCNVKKKKAYWTTILLLWRKLSFFSVYHWYSWVLLLYPYNVRINIKVLNLVWWRDDFRKWKCWKASRQNKIINIPTPNHLEQ